ncbi:DUF2934 domain-containing protein [Microvirga zambiensis]|uniref:DUF2934 domain-containing protein n=1 Tax=Microvirga zambiensis TaxID=1402137 RepID=UPI001FECF736|nr:DUF2934 domain-containing protein [Microvirga zambiensis]
MMDKKLEERIRERAYQLWMRHGSIHGRADEYWYQAEREVLGKSDDDDTRPAPIIDPAPLGMTSATDDEELAPPVAPKTRKKRTPAAAPVVSGVEGTEASTPTPKRRRPTRVS